MGKPFDETSLLIKEVRRPPEAPRETLATQLKKSFDIKLGVALLQNFFRDLVWSIVAAFGVDFRGRAGHLWREFWIQTGVQSLFGGGAIFIATLLPFLVLRCRKSFASLTLKPPLIAALATGLGALFSMMTWNLALYLTIRSAETALEFSAANFMASIATGFTEGATQLLVNKLVADTRCTKPSKPPACSRALLGSVFFNMLLKLPVMWLFNSIAGAVWQLSYFAYARNVLTHGDVNPVDFTGLVTGAVKDQPGLAVGLGLSVGLSVLACNALIPTLGLALAFYVGQRIKENCAQRSTHALSTASLPL